MVRPGGNREIISPVSKLNIRRGIGSNQVVSVHEVHELMKIRFAREVNVKLPQMMILLSNG